MKAGATEISSLSYRIGTKIRELRLKRGLDQQTLADRVGVTREYLCRIEHGTANPSIKLLTRLAEQLAVPEQMLVSDEILSLDDERLWHHFDQRTKEFLLKESSMPYIRLARRLSEKGVGKETIRAIEQLLLHRSQVL